MKRNQAGVPQGGWIVAIFESGLGLPIVVFMLVSAAWVWVHFLADCSSLGWMPVTSLPSRCLPR